MQVQMSGNMSHKAINNSLAAEPLTTLYKLLKEGNARDGHYFRILDRQMRFYPIYKIASTIEPPLPPDSDHHSKEKDKHKDYQQQPQLRHQVEGANRYRFLFGSQIYIKTAQLLSAEIQLIKPYFQNLYVWLEVKGKGFITTVEQQIHYHPNMQISSIWFCMAPPEQSKGQGSRQEVVFCNFDNGSYLFLDQSGVFMACAEERATRFVLKRIGGSSSYLLEGRNNLQEMVRNKSKEEIRRIIDKSLEKQGSRQSLQTEVDILPVEDSFITIQLQLSYAKKALELQPSLRLIGTIFDELIYYGIMDFLRDSSLINQHLQQLLLEYDIFLSIAGFLTKVCNLSKRRNTSRIEDSLSLRMTKKKSLFAPRTLDRIDQISMAQNTEVLSHYGNEELREVVRVIGVLCRQNLQVSKTFLSFVDLLISNRFYLFAQELVRANQFFISNFHRMRWYEDLYACLLKPSKKEIASAIEFMCVFCSVQSAFESAISNICYRQVPATNNQYLLYHTFKGSDLQGKIFQFQLYSEGAYVFVHDSKTAKDVEFQTFMEESEGEGGSDQYIKEQRMKEELTMMVLEDNQAILLNQLNFIKAITQSCNLNIIHQYWPIVHSLAPYCFRKNFPQLHNPFVKKAILGLLFHTETIHSVASSKNLISFIEVQDGKRVAKEEVQPKSSVDQFMRIVRKRAQNSRKTFQQMGQHFLRVVKEWTGAIQKKETTISEVIQGSSQSNLQEWLQIMTLYLSMRLTKVKEKKEGQLLGYIKKFFESVEKENAEQSEADQHLITHFVEFLLEILKFNPKYERFLSHLKVKRNYEPKFANQINKVISNLQGKREVVFRRKNKDLTKIYFVQNVLKSLDRENIRQSNPGSGGRHFQEGQIFGLKMVSAKLLGCILRNVNEEMIDESVETLTYLVKNPSGLSNVSSFGLLEMLPSFPLESQMKKVVLESWYFASNCKQLEELTTVLRLLYCKNNLFRMEVNEVYLFDRPQLLPLFNSLTYPVRYIRHISASCQSWLRQSLLDKYCDIYEAVVHYLEIIAANLRKIQERNEIELISHIMENLELAKSLGSMVQYLSPFYLEEQRSRGKDSKLFNINLENVFVESKLNPISNSIIKIFDLYMNTNTAVNMRETKLVLQTLGGAITEACYFCPIILKTFSRVDVIPRENFLALLDCIPTSVILNLFSHLPHTWPFFETYCYLRGQHLLRHVQKLHTLCFKKEEFELFPVQELMLLASHDPKGSNYREVLAQMGVFLPQYQFIHQLSFLKLLLRLAYQNVTSIDFVLEFRDRIFWHILKPSQMSYQKSQKAVELSQWDILRRRVLVELACEYKLSIILNPSPYILAEGQHQVVQQVINHVRNFVKEEIKQARQKLAVAFGSSSLGLGVDSVPENIRFDYLSYLVCDLLVLAREVNLLLIEREILLFFQECRQLLKNELRIRVIERENDPSPSLLAKIDRELQGNEEEGIRTRKVLLPSFYEDNVAPAEKRQKSKPLRKWEKAVNQLNSQKFISKHSDLVEDMLELDSIYVFKSDNQNINLVLNHEDFFLKMLEISLNFKRLSLSIQNQIFLLEQILVVVRRKLQGKQPSKEVEGYALRLFESIAEEENLAEINRREQDFQPWKGNVACLSLKLMIVEKSRVFAREGGPRQHFEPLLNLLATACNNYGLDCGFFQLFKGTVHSKDEHSLYEHPLPFDILLSILIQQVTPGRMEEYYRPFMFEVTVAFLTISTHSPCSFRKYQTSDLQTFVEEIEKGQFLNIYQEIDQMPYLKHLFALKK